MPHPIKRTVFFVSDGTGLTVEALGHSLMTQFEDIEFKQIRIPFLDNVEKAPEGYHVTAKTPGVPVAVRTTAWASPVVSTCTGSSDSTPTSTLPA